MIGDPGGRQDERSLLTKEVLEGYLEGIRRQLGQFLDPSLNVLLDNSVWLGQLSTLEFLRDVGKHFTVNQMVGKESVRSRFDRPDQGISYTSCACTWTTAATCRSGEVTSGATSPWVSTTSARSARKKCGD